MPLPNRVDPFGELIATPARGLFFGNRGGRFHRDDRTLGARRWVSRCWICCRLEFKGRHRSVWGKGYTELFFLDEVTALAAGHRPCFECRRADAQAFAAAFAAARGLAAAPRAPEIDRVLHAERLDGRAKRRHRRALDELPDGAFVTFAQPPRGSRRACRRTRAASWRCAAMRCCRGRQRVTSRAASARAGSKSTCSRRPPMLAALSAGYAPRWHPSAQK